MKGAHIRLVVFMLAVLGGLLLFGARAGAGLPSDVTSR